MSETPNGNSKHSKITLRLLIYTFVALAVIATAWYLISGGHKTNTSSENKTTTVAPAPLHTNEEAVEAAKMLYDNYLPFKAQVVADVGDNPNVEPAAVQVVRGAKDYFSQDLYQSILADYMSEYQSTGKVTKDDISCVNNSTNTYTAVFDSTYGDSAIVNITLTLSDSSSKVIPVMFDLHTLEATKIDCSK